MIFKCIVCGKVEVLGCDDIGGRRIVIHYHICDECYKKQLREIEKFMENISNAVGVKHG